MVGGLEPWFFYDFPLGIIIPTDELIFFRGVETTNHIYIYISTGSRYLPLVYLLIQAFIHVQILHPLQHFVLSVKMKVALRCGFGTRMFVLYWHSQVFVLDSPSSNVFFFICSPRSFQVTWSFPTLWSSWHGCPNCFATRSPKHMTHMTLAFQHSRSVFDVKRLRQCLFKTLPPTVDTLCGSDHCPRFLPGSHLLCELIFVVWDMNMFNLWRALGTPPWPALCTIRVKLSLATVESVAPRAS